MSSDRDDRKTQRVDESLRRAEDRVRRAQERADAALRRAEGEIARAEQRAEQAIARGEEAAAGGPLGGPFGILWEARPPAGGRGRGRGRGRGSGLTREDIVAAALHVADTEGPDAISMRRIAGELGVGTMSLYHHVPTKDDLLDLMHDVVMGELVVPDDELPAGWREAATEISRRTRDVYLRHRWIVSGAWERPQMGPRAFAHVEQSLSVFAGMDLGVQEVGEILGALDDYVIGFVSRHLAAQRAMQRAGMTMDEYQQALEPYVRRLIDAGDYPNLQRFAEEDWRVEDEPRFEQGLRWMLDGIAAMLAGRGIAG